ncbi:MAG: hypothetical protein AAFZ05_09795, partial [Pseudomonadota bacterium]
EAIVAVAMAPDITSSATDARSEPAEEPAPADAPALPPTIARIKTEPAALPRTSGTDLRRAMFGASADDENAEDDFAADEDDAFEDDIAEETAARGKGAMADPSAQAQTAMGAFQRLKAMASRTQPRMRGSSVAMAQVSDETDAGTIEDPEVFAEDDRNVEDEAAAANVEESEPLSTDADADASGDADLGLQEERADDAFRVAEALASDSEIATIAARDDDLPEIDEADDTAQLDLLAQLSEPAPAPRQSALLANARIRAFRPPWQSR